MGAYIDEAIDSVRASSYRPVEILVIDDGSDDETSIAALRCWAGVEGVRVHRKNNEGLAETRNFGATLAGGNYLAFLDADDQVEPTYYEKAIRVLRQYENVFFAGSWVRYFGTSARRWATFTPQPPYLLAHNPINSSGLVYKTSAFLRAGLNDKAAGYGLEDYESVVSMMAAGYNGVAIPEFLFRYRVREGSMSRDISKAKLLYSYKYISEKHRAYYAGHSIELINLLNANGPGIFFDNPSMAMRVTATMDKKIIPPYDLCDLT
jgi:glycosyltransferase involved in cell wall biosynthesis